MENEDIKKLEDIIEDIQKIIVDTGGRFIRRNVLKNMSVEEMLQELLPNRIEFTVGYVPPQKTPELKKPAPELKKPAQIDDDEDIWDSL